MKNSGGRMKLTTAEQAILMKRVAENERNNRVAEELERANAKITSTMLNTAA